MPRPQNTYVFAGKRLRVQLWICDLQIACRRTDSKDGESEMFVTYYPTIWVRKDGKCWQEHVDGDPYLAWDNVESALVSMLDGITERLAHRRRYAATVA